MDIKKFATTFVSITFLVIALAVLSITTTYAKAVYTPTENGVHTATYFNEDN